MSIVLSPPCLFGDNRAFGLEQDNHATLLIANSEFLLLI